MRVPHGRASGCGRPGDDPPRRPVALRYAAGHRGRAGRSGSLRLALPDDAWLACRSSCSWCAELAVPVLAERAGPMTSWHPEHIAERYGLFTLIVLGEAILPRRPRSGSG